MKNSEGNYTLGRGNEWNFNTKYKTPYIETGNKGQGLVSVPSYNAVTNDYSRNYDVFYRSIKENHYKRLMETGNMPPGTETSISQVHSYTENYNGINLEFRLKPGTKRIFENIGVKNSHADKIDELYPDMKESFKGCKKYGYVQFKQEGKQITINLGNKRGLEIFNQNLKDYKFLKEINDRNRKKIEKIINNVETIL